MFTPLDGPAIQGSISVGTGAVVEAKVGASVLSERKVITIQPSGKIKLLFAQEGVTPSTSDLSTKGFTIFKDAIETFEVGELQKVYMLSVSGTINVMVAERA